MRILYISQYFPPESGATQTRAFEMARNWVRLGHQVTMLAEFPNHPVGIIPPEYRGKFWEKDRLEGIDVVRVWVYTSPEKNFLTRMLFYISFMINAILAGLLAAREPFDLIYASSPPLFVGGAALALKFLRRAPMVFEVRDLWPESAIELGELSNNLAIRLATKLEEACYRAAVKIIVVTQPTLDHLLQRKVPEHKLLLVPNGTNVSMFKYSNEDRERIRNTLGIQDKFVAIYAGILGIAQGLDCIIEAANLAKSKKDIHFLVVGDGPKRVELENLAKQYGLTNITFLGNRPHREMPGLLSAADVALIPLRKLEIFSIVLPSKMFDAWACERPILLGVDGEARKILEACGGGLYVTPEDPGDLVLRLLELKNNPQDCQVMGKKARQYTETNFSRQQQAQNLIQILAGLTRLQ